MSTLAQNLVYMVNQFGYDDEYDYGRRIDVPFDFIDAWRDRAVSVEYPYGTDSFDATEVWRFEDSSAVYIGNPRQTVFCLICQLLKD